MCYFPGCTERCRCRFIFDPAAIPSTWHDVNLTRNTGHRSGDIVGIFRFENKYAAPTRGQRERYMRGEVEEHHFGPEGEITLLLYPEAAYLKDDREGVRILFTGISEKPHAVEEARRMVEYHQLREDRMRSFTTGDHM
jgi:hypothetical protein